MDCRQTVLDQENLQSVVVDDRDVEGVTISEPEADSPLVVDSDAPLASAFAFQCFEVVRRRLLQVVDLVRCVELREAHRCPDPNLRRITSRPSCGEEPLGLAVGKGLKHQKNCKRGVYDGQA